MKQKVFTPFYALAVMILVVGLACGSTTKATDQPTEQRPTNPQPAQPTDTPVPPQPTLIPPPTDVPQPTAKPDVEGRLKSAKILVYDDMGYYGAWIEEALKQGGYTFTSSRGPGDFQASLTSGEKWDLIIAGVEWPTAGVSGDLWTYIKNYVDQGTAMITNPWYLQFEGEGKVKPLLSGCGVKFSKALDGAASIVKYSADHPVFTTPNSIGPIGVNQFWGDGNINLLEVTGNGDAVVLAGTDANNKSVGDLVTCYGGRVIFSTFSNHDYNHAAIVSLWVNYVHWVLTNRFQAGY
jgi:hypothetical protein